MSRDSRLKLEIWNLLGWEAEESCGNPCDMEKETAEYIRTYQKTQKRNIMSPGTPLTPTIIEHRITVLMQKNKITWYVTSWGDGPYIYNGSCIRKSLIKLLQAHKDTASEQHHTHTQAHNKPDCSLFKCPRKSKIQTPEWEPWVT